MTKTVKPYIAEDYVCIDGITLQTFRDDIDDWIKQYGPNAYFYLEPHHYDDGEKLVIKAVREETDEEYAIRMKSNEEYRLAQEEKDRKEYERLKAKFGE